MDDGEEPWIFNGDDLQRRIVGHKCMLRRWQSDRKKDRRFSVGYRAENQEDMERRVLKHTSFQKTVIEQTAAMVVGMAKRKQRETIVYHDAEHGFIPDGPYAQLREAVRKKCDSMGLCFKLASDEVVNSSPGTARVQEPLS